MKTNQSQSIQEIECKNFAYKAFAIYERKNGINTITFYIK